GPGGGLGGLGRPGGRAPFVLGSGGRPEDRLQADAGQRAFHIELPGAPDRAVEPGTQVFAGDLARGLLHAVLGKAWRSSVPLEEKAHHVVERAGAGSAAADLQVEQEPDDAALQVVRDRGVGGALVRPVVLDPRVVRGLGERRSQPPGGANAARDRKSTRLNSSHRTISYAV